VPAQMGVFFQAENGVIGLGARPAEGMEDPHLTDAGGGFVSAVPGAASIDSAMSFGLIRGGHLDMTVLGGLQVNEAGQLANWKVPGKMVPGMGGAMDLVAGVRSVVVLMEHVAKRKDGGFDLKILPHCNLPLTGLGVVDRIITDLAVLDVTPHGLKVVEMAPGVTREELQSKTGVTLQ